MKKLIEQPAKNNWHRWFAWHPVPLCAPVPGKVAWLRTVARLRLNGEWIYDEAFRANPPLPFDNSLAGAMERSRKYAAR